jgi:hypothetical protein
LASFTPESGNEEHQVKKINMNASAPLTNGLAAIDLPTAWKKLKM